MSYTAPDFSDAAIELLTHAGYAVVSCTDGINFDPGVVYWWTLTQPSMQTIESGEHCDTALEAWISALAHSLRRAAAAPAIDGEDQPDPQGGYTFPDAMLADLMVTATEGGINYWCYIIHRHGYKMAGDLVGSIASFEAETADESHHPDIKAAEIGLFTCDFTSLRAGITRLLAPGATVSPTTRACFVIAGLDADAADLDADCADAAVQFAVFGEIVFG